VKSKLMPLQKFWSALALSLLIGLCLCSLGARAAVSYQAAGTAVNGTGSVTPTWPVHAIGDIALLFVESTGGEAVTLSTPSTFALLTTQSIGATTSGTRLTVFWARATSAAMAAPVVADPGNHVYAQILTYRGAVATGNPWDVTGGGTSAPFVLDAVTTTVANTRVVQTISRDNDSANANFSAETNANLTGITERNDGGTSSGNGGGFAVWDGVKATAGSIGNTTVTSANSVLSAYLTIALSPSGASAPTYQATGNAASGTGAVTPTWPSHATNDIGLLFVESTGGQAVTAPAGWTAVTNSPQANGAGTAGTRLSVFWIRATSNGMTNPTVADPGDHVYALIITYRGVVTSGNPWNVTGGNIGPLLTVSGVTTATANTLIVQAASRDNDASGAYFSGQTNANLTGIVERVDGGTTSGNGGGFAIWDGSLATAGATGNTTVTPAANISSAFVTIALKPFVTALDHIRIAHDGSASTCGPEPVTLIACANAACTAPHYTGSDVTGINLLPTTSSYTWSPASTASILAASGGVNTGITLARSTGGTASLSITGTPSPAPTNVYECYNTTTSTSGDCNLVYAAGALTFNVLDHVADTQQQVTVTTCSASFANTTRSVKFWTTYINPNSGTLTGKIAAGGVSVNNADCSSGYASLATSSASPTSVNLNFGTGAAPQATFTLCYPDVGEVRLDAKYDGSASNTPPDAGVTILGTDSSFFVRPDHFSVTGIKCTSTSAANCAAGARAMPTPGDNPAASDQTGGAFMRAGDSTQTAAKFTATITAKNAHDNVTPNFGREAAPGPAGITLTSVLVAPTPGNAGTLTCKGSTANCVILGGATNFSNGATTVTDLAWSEVGILSIDPALNPASYLSSGGIAMPTNSGNIGRFIPDHFGVTTPSIVPLLSLYPVLTRASLTPTVTTATGTAAPATVIGVAATTGFTIGSRVRIPGAGAGNTAFTATVTAVDTVGSTLTLDTAIGTDINTADPVIPEWGSYMGETMNAQFDLVAQNVGGGTTTNYKGVYAKLDPTVPGNPLNFGAVSGGTNLTSRLNTPTLTSALISGTTYSNIFQNGTASIVAPLTISRSSSPDGPYSSVKFGIAPESRIPPLESDGVQMGSYDLNVGGSNDHTSIMDASVQTTTEVRFGRLRLINAYGSELLPPRVGYRLEYWAGSQWQVNVADSETPLEAGNIYSGSLGAPTRLTSPTRGVGVITFAPAAVGIYDIAVNLNASGNDTSCNASHGGTTAANMPWLKGFWSPQATCNGTAAWLQDPNARIKLGSPKAAYIYMRERY